MAYLPKNGKGDVAHLEEHHNGIVGVVGSNPINSTIDFEPTLKW